MVKYIKVDWPESQKFMEEEYEDTCYQCDDMVVFVPEDLYNEIINKKNV